MKAVCKAVLPCSHFEGLFAHCDPVLSMMTLKGTENTHTLYFQGIVAGQGQKNYPNIQPVRMLYVRMFNSCLPLLLLSLGMV